MRKVMTALVLLLMSAVVTVPATADQHDSRLKSLFDALKTATSPARATYAEMIIWQIWSDSGNPALDQLLHEGSDAMAKDDYPTALRKFSELVGKKPDFAEGWNRRATLYYLMGDYKASIADIDRVLELEPRHFGALAGLGLINIQLERDEAAKDAFERVLDVYPLNASAKANLEFVQKKLDGKSI
jgi:tetratricopeptide (TPR) repeat protein